MITRPVLASLCGAMLVAAAPQTAPAAQASINERLTGDLSPVHDPAIIRQGETYYPLTTTQEKDGGGLIHIRTSTDLVNWKRSGAVFERMLLGWTPDGWPVAL